MGPYVKGCSEITGDLANREHPTDGAVGSYRWLAGVLGRRLTQMATDHADQMVRRVIPAGGSFRRRRGGLSCRGQQAPEDRAATDGVLGPNPAAMGSHDRPADR